jgi:hypothetical protein
MYAHMWGIGMHLHIYLNVKKFLCFGSGLVRFHVENFSLNKLNKLQGKHQYCVKVWGMFIGLENLDAEVDISRAWKTIRQHIKTTVKGNLG